MMHSRITRVLVTVGALLSITMSPDHAMAREGFWQGDVSTEWNTAGNWFVVGAPGDGGFVPQQASGFNVRALIGTDSPSGALNTTAGNSPVISAVLPGAKATIGGLYLGVRQLDYTVSPPVFVNPAPAAGALVGQLTINAGTLNNITTSEATFGADGRIMVGVDGRGYLTMNGGTLTGTALTVAGENVTTGNGTSLLDLRGSSTLTVNGAASFSRRLRIEGPSVNFTTTGQLQLNSTNSYTAAVTGATAHSPLKVTTFGQKALVDGTLNIEFSGAAATRDPITSLGTKWSLMEVNSLAEDAIDGKFSNVGSDGSIAVVGLDAAHSAPLGTAYKVNKRTSGGNTLLELSYEQVLILTVNRDSGVMSIRNPYGGDIGIDTYSISSARGSMKNTFAGLGTTTPGAGDWAKPAGNNANVISDVKVPDQTPPITNEDAYELLAVPTVSIGNGFNKLAVASNVANFGFDGEDLIFQYGGPDSNDVPIRGHIEYVGSKFENNLVLRVNPNNGVATLKNDSLETLVFDGFEITSTDVAAALNVTTFTPITGGTGTWQKDAEGTTGLSQVNFTGARTLTPGQEVSIGDISSLTNPFATDAAKNGLSMRFILAEGLESSAATGDYNNNGVVDAADYTLWRDNLGGPATELANRDPLNTGVISNADYTSWVANFGATGGILPELTYREGSVFFDTALGAGAGGLALSAVPEPSTGLLLLAGLGGVLFTRRRQQFDSAAQCDDSEQTKTESDQVGVNTMSRRVAVFAVLTFAAVIGAAQQAAAVTGGIPLTNFDMELPGPLGTKTVAFEDDGTPIPGIIPGWTFTGGAGGIGEVNGLGNEDFGDDDSLGDSGTEGSGFTEHGQEMLLSTNDGRAYQIAAGHVIANPAVNQQYKIGFDAVNIFTINAGANPGFQLTARVFAGAYPGTTLKTFNAVSTEGVSGFEHYEILIPRNDPSLTAGVIGQSLGIAFDTTSREFNPDVTKSWAGIDNVVMEITGVLPGDLNGDGVVNISDSTSLLANMQARTPFEASGELTNDNLVNLNDFRVLKSLIAAGSGSGGIAGGSNVPEPSSIALLLAVLGLSSGTFARSRRRVRCERALVIAMAAIGFVAMQSAESHAVLLSYDPFLIGNNAAAGEYIETTFTGDPPVAVNPLAGQNPIIGPSPAFFSGPWVTGAEGQVVQATGLSYLGTPSQGGAVSGFGRTDRFFATQWDATTVGTFYIGLQASFGNTPDTNMGYRAIEFFPPNVTPGENRIGDIGYNQFFSSFGAPQQNPTSAKMQFNIGGQQIIGPSPASFNNDGLTHLLVLKFELTTDAAGDRVSLYFDPKTPNEPSAPANLAQNFDFELGAIGAASFGNGLGATTILDEIRVGTTFADVLPPDLPIPGDVNGDKVVNILDYNIIFANMNQPGGQSLAQGDVDGDGKVTIGDYRFWKERRSLLAPGGGGIGGATGVPEPTSALLIAVGMALLSLPAQRRVRV
jgi:hypothetical protein